MTKLYSKEPEIVLDGVSVTKRVMQLFNPRYQKDLDRKATLAIESEKLARKSFVKFSTAKKLKILDEARNSKMKKSEKKANNIKW